MINDQIRLYIHTGLDGRFPKKRSSLDGRFPKKDQVLMVDFKTNVFFVRDKVACFSEGLDTLTSFECISA